MRGHKIGKEIINAWLLPKLAYGCWEGGGVLGGETGGKESTGEN